MTVEVQQGAIATLEFELRNRSGVLADADDGVISLTVTELDEDPVDGFPVNEDVIEHVSTGRYRYLWSVPDDQDLGAYTATWSCEVGGEAVVPPSGTESVVVIPPTIPASPFVTVTEVRALVNTSVSDDSLEDLIQREQAILEAEVGPLGGARTETITITRDNKRLPVRLRRPTSDVVVAEDNGTITDIRLGADARSVYRLLETGWETTPWLGVIEVTYTPNDSAKVTSWLIELVRARLAETPYQSESFVDYSYTRGTSSYESTLRRAVNDILGRRGSAASVRMSTDASRAPAWLGEVRP